MSYLVLEHEFLTLWAVDETGACAPQVSARYTQMGKVLDAVETSYVHVVSVTSLTKVEGAGETSGWSYDNALTLSAHHPEWLDALEDDSVFQESFTEVCNQRGISIDSWTFTFEMPHSPC